MKIYYGVYSSYLTLLIIDGINIRYGELPFPHFRLLSILSRKSIELNRNLTNETE